MSTIKNIENNDFKSKGYVSIYEMERAHEVAGLCGSASPHHQLLCSAITSRLNVYFKRSNRFSGLRAFQETRTDNEKEDYIIPDVTVSIKQNSEMIILIEVCRDGNVDNDFDKMKKYIETHKSNCEKIKELFVVEYKFEDENNEGTNWWRVSIKNNEYEDKQPTSRSKTIDFNLKDCIEWFVGEK